MSEADTLYEQQNKLIQGYMKEFDNIYLKEDKNLPGVRTVTYNGRAVTIQEFVKIKLIENNK